jgi:two-component system, repressor protein LuxO
MARVLLVEDNADTLALRTLIFERRGHHVLAASSACLAREQFRAEPPESVIMDLRLPDAEDGLALIREFRAASSQVKIVVVAGLLSDIDGRDERALVDVILAKPVRSEVLLNSIR